MKHSLLSVIPAVMVIVGCQAVRMARPDELADPKLEIPVAKKSVATGNELRFSTLRIFGVVDSGVDSKGASVQIGGWGGGKTERKRDYRFSLEDTAIKGKVWQVDCHSEFKASRTMIAGINAGGKGEQTTLCAVKGVDTWEVRINHPVDGMPSGQLTGEAMALSLEPISKTTKGRDTGSLLGYGIRRDGSYVAAAELLQNGYWWELPGNPQAVHAAAGVLMGVAYHYQTISN
jgi:hypothetical protein